MADDLYGGYAPNPIFQKLYRFIDSLLYCVFVIKRVSGTVL